jgi:hypothetical protein
MNDGGVTTLSIREATTSSIRADGLSEDLEPLLDEIADKTITAAFYWAENGNVYFFLDESNDGVNDACIVFSTRTKKWTKYNNYNANEAVLWEDSAGDKHFLLANSINGQCKEAETTFTDSGNPIDVEIQTKNWDFDQPETLKTFENIEVFGFINSTGEIKVSATVDDSETTPEATILGSSYVEAGTESAVLGTFLLGSSALGGATGEDAVLMYPFKARIPLYITGSRIKIRLHSNKVNTTWILSKISIYPFAQAMDVFPVDNIY